MRERCDGGPHAGEAASPGTQLQVRPSRGVEMTPRERSTGRSEALTTFSHARIMVVDDDLSALLMMDRLLRQSGYSKVRCVETPAQVGRACAEFRPDLIIIDIWMPATSGIVLLEQLRSRDGECHDVPVLVLSGDADPRIRHQALASGARDYLMKPFSAPRLVDRIEELLSRRLVVTRGERFE